MLPRVKTLHRISAAAVTASLLAGCSMRPQPITQVQHVERAAADRAAIDAAYVPLSGPLTLEEAIARALKYNYDAQLSKLELTLQERQLDLAMAQMLPKVAADAGYTARNNDPSSQSISQLTQQQSLEYSYSEEPTHATGDIAFSWNFMDVGISYYQAKQQGFRALIAVERRRKTVEGIIKSVIETYSRAQAAERILPRLDPLLASAQNMLDASRTAGREKLQSPLALLDYQQKIIQITGELRRMKSDLSTARIQLASLINVPVDSLTTLSAPDDDAPAAQVSRRRLEDIGLAMRPELRIEAYQERIDRQDIYKEILKMMPGVGILADGNVDTNKLLYNSTWGELGVRATFNLMNMIQGPQAISAAKVTVRVDRERRLALSVALLTQINLAYGQYVGALDDLATADQVAAVGRDMMTAADNASAAGVQADSDLVRHKLAALVTELDRDRAAASVRAALANVYSSVGVDLVPASADLENLPRLTADVKHAIAGWERGYLPDPASVPKN